MSYFPIFSSSGQHIHIFGIWACAWVLTVEMPRALSDASTNWIVPIFPYAFAFGALPHIWWNSEYIFPPCADQVAFCKRLSIFSYKRELWMARVIETSPGGKQDKSVSGQSFLCPPYGNIGNLAIQHAFQVNWNNEKDCVIQHVCQRKMVKLVTGVKHLTDLKDAVLCSRSQVDLRTVISVSSQVKNEKKNVVYWETIFRG